MNGCSKLQAALLRSHDQRAETPRPPSSIMSSVGKQASAAPLVGSCLHLQCTSSQFYKWNIGAHVSIGAWWASAAAAGMRLQTGPLRVLRAAKNEGITVTNWLAVCYDLFIDQIFCCWLLSVVCWGGGTEGGREDPHKLMWRSELHNNSSDFFSHRISKVWIS